MKLPSSLTYIAPDAFENASVLSLTADKNTYAYQWLADLICAPKSEAHIGYLGEYYCKKVIEESKGMLERSRKKRAGDGKALPANRTH